MLFWLGLVAGLILGWVIEWIIDWRFWRRQLQTALDVERQLRQELADAHLEIRQLQAQQAALSWPAKETISALVKRDPLEEIPGVGPIFAQRLHEAGIFTFAQLATTPVETVMHAIQAEDGSRPNVAEWIAQAKRAANTEPHDSLSSVA